jgi:hypothetical protein
MLVPPLLAKVVVSLFCLELDPLEVAVCWLVLLEACLLVLSTCSLDPLMRVPDPFLWRLVLLSLVLLDPFLWLAVRVAVARGLVLT